MSDHLSGPRWEENPIPADANEQERVWTIRNFTTPDTLIQNVVGPETLEEKVVPLAAFQAERERADGLDSAAKSWRATAEFRLAAEKKAEDWEERAWQQSERADRYREALERIAGHYISGGDVRFIARSALKGAMADWSRYGSKCYAYRESKAEGGAGTAHRRGVSN